MNFRDHLNNIGNSISNWGEKPENLPQVTYAVCCDEDWNLIDCVNTNYYPMLSGVIFHKPKHLTSIRAFTYGKKIEEHINPNAYVFTVNKPRHVQYIKFEILNEMIMGMYSSGISVGDHLKNIHLLEEIVSFDQLRHLETTEILTALKV